MPFGINGEVNIDFNSDGQIDYQIDHDRVNLSGTNLDYLQIDKNDVSSAANPYPIDNFAVFPPEGDTGAPAVSLSAPAAGMTLAGVTSVQATAADELGVGKVEFYVDNVLRFTDVAAPYRWDFDTVFASNGPHTLAARAYDVAGNVAQASVQITTQNSAALPVPDLPRKYSHIRLAQLAYGGTRFGPLEDQLLADSLDAPVDFVDSDD